MTMNEQRLQHLVDAYGGDLCRWPEAEREAARALLKAVPELAVKLEAGHQLDALLSASRQPAVSMALRDRVLASALLAGLGPRRLRIWRDRLALAFGAGWTAAACAGVAAGFILSAQVSADASADAILYQASQSTLDDSELVG